MAQQNAQGWKEGRFLAPAAIFLGAFFLFEVEPLIAKLIVPWFGGTAEVWTACLLFFQAALLGGYLYAHLLNTKLSPQWQLRVHLSLLALSLLWLPILPSDYWKPQGNVNPLLRILELLTATIGLPFLLLSATGPLMQAWIAHGRAKAPYRLFALSNFASMLALLSYPVVVEPMLPLRLQGWLWSAGYALFVLLSAASAWTYRRHAPPTPTLTAEGESPPASTIALWFVLAALPSALLLAITNHMLRNIAAIPLLWVVPLALYLFSFILCFDRSRWYSRLFWCPLFVTLTGAMMYAVANDFPYEDARLLIAFYAVGFLACCVVCHGELAAVKPIPRHLTLYYLTIAAGGAAGGMFVAIVAPIVFSGYLELPLLLPGTALVAIYAVWRHYAPSRTTSRQSDLQWGILAVVSLLWIAGTSHLARAVYESESGNVFSGRNFYGALKVTDYSASDGTPAMRQLQNGTILHGTEFTGLQQRRIPLSYYSPLSGVGLSLAALNTGGPIKVGVVGLGAGTIAAYCRKGDSYVFYDINPLVRNIANSYFWYVPLCPAKIDIVMGDARLSMERQAPQRFDLIAVDAFSSDAIPIHLLTVEAFALYWRHLKPDGILAIHVSNKYVDLAPIVAMASKGSGKSVRLVSNYADALAATEGSDWVLITSRSGFFDRPEFNYSSELSASAALRPWTDDYSNIWQVLRYDSSLEYGQSLFD